MWKNIVEPGRPQMTIWRVLHSVYSRPQILRICNTYYFSTATVVAWMRLIVMLHVHWLSGCTYLCTILASWKLMDAAEDSFAFICARIFC